VRIEGEGWVHIGVVEGEGEMFGSLGGPWSGFQRFSRSNKVSVFFFNRELVDMANWAKPSGAERRVAARQKGTFRPKKSDHFSSQTLLMERSVMHKQLHYYIILLFYASDRLTMVEETR